jgi:hypothetical protein
MVRVVGRGKRSEVFADSISKELSVHIPIGKSCDALQRGKVYLHSSPYVKSDPGRV